MEIDDLISEGSLGLVQAVERFDPDNGARLASYATWWIKAKIYQHILDSWSIVTLATTGSRKSLFFRLRRLKTMIHSETGDLSQEHVDLIAKKLGTPASDVVLVNRWLLQRDFSLNTPLGEDDDSGTWQDTLVDGADNQEYGLSQRQEIAFRRALLDSALVSLSPRERDILVGRNGAGAHQTLGVFAVRYAISTQRVRQIEQDAIRKVTRIIHARKATAPAFA